MTTGNKNPYLIDVSNDFGFTTSSIDFEKLESEKLSLSSQKSELEEKLDDYRMRLEAIQKIYLPFLESLAKDPDKQFIKWPNRKEVLDKQIQKLLQLTTIK